MEQFKAEAWVASVTDAEVDLDEMIYRHRDPDEALPWDHIGIHVSKRMLQREYARALAAAEPAESSLAGAPA